MSVSQLQVQEAADCLGADCVPRYVEMKKLLELEIDDVFQMKQKVINFQTSRPVFTVHDVNSFLCLGK